MYKHILMATDGSEFASKAVAEGLALAKASDAKVTVITVTSPFNSMGDRQHMFSGLPSDMRQQAIDYLFDESRKTLEQAGNAAKASGVECTLKSVEHHHPYEAIVAAAEEDGCDLIVMASHGRSGASALLLGSETTKVLTHTKVPVLVCR